MYDVRIERYRKILDNGAEIIRYREIIYDRDQNYKENN